MMLGSKKAGKQIGTANAPLTLSRGILNEVDLKSTLI